MIELALVAGVTELLVIVLPCLAHRLEVASRGTI